MTIDQSEDSSVIKLSQRHLTNTIVEKCAREGTRPVNTPAASNLFDNEDDDELLPNNNSFLSIVMSLMYLARLTRPDLLLPVTYLASRGHAPIFSVQIPPCTAIAMPAMVYTAMEEATPAISSAMGLTHLSCMPAASNRSLRPSPQLMLKSLLPARPSALRFGCVICTMRYIQHWDQLLSRSFSTKTISPRFG